MSPFPQPASRPRAVPRAATAALWAAGAALFAVRVAVALRERGGDFRLVWLSLRRFVGDGRPYANRAFPYPPSSLLLLGGFGTLPFPVAHLWFVLLDAAAILLGAALCVRLFGVPWRSPLAPAMLLAVGLFAPVTQTLNAANVNGLVFAAEAGALLLAARGRPALAGVPFGLGLAIKPVLLPALPLFALGRRWAGAAVALLVPVALSIPAALAIRDASVYLGRIVPCPPVEFFGENVALTGAAWLLGAPALATPLRVAVGAAALWVGVRLLRRPHPEPAVALAELSGAGLVAAFLLSCYAWPYYGLFLLPALAAAVRPGAALRRWPGLLAAYALGGPDVRLWLMAGPAGDALVHVRVTAGFLLFLLALGLGAAARPAGRPAAGPESPAGTHA